MCLCFLQSATLNFTPPPPFFLFSFCCPCLLSVCLSHSDLDLFCVVRSHCLAGTISWAGLKKSQTLERQNIPFYNPILILRSDLRSTSLLERCQCKNTSDGTVCTVSCAAPFLNDLIEMAVARQNFGLCHERHSVRGWNCLLSSLSHKAKNTFASARAEPHHRLTLTPSVSPLPCSTLCRVHT